MKGIVPVWGMALGVVIAAPHHSANAQAKRPMTFEDFAAVRVVTDPQLSPDGRTVLYAVRTTDVEANKRMTTTYTAGLAGGAPAPFPNGSVHASEARWSPDGRQVAYIADDQLWIADASGANARQLTKLTGGISGPVWAPSGTWIGFVSRVYPSCSDDPCNAAKQQAQATRKVKAYVVDQLMFRHWTAYDDSTRAHLFVVAPSGAGLHDVTPGVRYDVPPGPFGGSEGYSFSPDGKELAYTAKDQGREDAWSTDLNVYTVPVQGGTPVVITASNRGADENPVYAPDGRTILYHSQERAGFESDAWHLMQYDRTTHTATRLAPAWDRNADSYLFAPDGHTIYLQTTDAAREKLYALTERGKAWDAAPTLVVSGHNNGGFSLSKDGRTMVWLRDAVEHPPEVYTGTVGTTGVANVRPLTHENDALIAQLQLNPAEEFWFKGALGDSVQGFVIKPPQYQPGKKFPVLLIIHGGPQSAFLDCWHLRWNFSLFASGGGGNAGGFAIVFMNPHASPGYGQKFVDEVSKDWGGAPYKDLMMGLDTAMARNVAWMDTTHVGAAGASYGGYMVNWIAGHTTRFKALFTHDGVFNLENMYGATEELWFPDWEYGGPYWDKHAMETQNRVWSPHLFAANFRTPHLIVHGELDYRVPFSEGMSLFSALQRQGVPSRLIIFPDEGHWVSKPQNQRLWYGEVFSWFDKYLRAP
ncbi:MAG TPA: S9 family peptidase [Gemmatimonadaceae bacterium]|nr:S9 family peptidase [Gemmatimonadaceae bacterium]